MPFGFNTCIPGFQFSPMIWSVCSSNPFHNLNMMWNDSMMKLQCDNLMYQSYAGGMNGAFFPIFGNSYYSVPNMLAQMTFDQFQQKQQFGGGYGNFGLPGFGNFGWGQYGNNGANSGGNGGGNTVEKQEFNKLKALIQKLKNPECGWTNDMEEAYKEALKKSTDEEKIAALKEILSGMDSGIVTKTILDMPEFKTALVKAGYNFPSSESNANNGDVEKKKSMEVIHQELSGDKPKVDALWQLIANDGDTKTDNILGNLSFWNSKYPNEKGILGLVASKIPNTDTSLWQGAVHNITMQLVNKANEYSDLDTKKKAITDTLTKIDNAFDSNNIAEAKRLIAEMMPKFNDLYKELRIKDAQKINKKIRETYKIDCIAEDVILSSTKSDLEGEGFTGVKIQAASVEGSQGHSNHTVRVNYSEVDKLASAEAKVDALEKAGDIEYDEEHDVYYTDTTSTNADKKFYGVKDGKLVEYVGVKNADEIKETTPTKEVKRTEGIHKYKESVERVDRLVEEGKIKRTSDDNNKGVVVYFSTGKDPKLANKNRYYVIRNNELKEIKGYVVSKNGYVFDPKNPKNDAVKVHVSQLKDMHVADFEDEDVPTATATAAAATTTVAETAEQDKKIAENVAKITEQTFDKYSAINSKVRSEFGLTKLSVKGYLKDQNDQYYRYDQKTHKLVHLKNVKNISAAGVMTMKNGEKKPCQEFESAYNSGKDLIQSIAGSTDEAGYNEMRRKLNSLKTYTKCDDIYSFFKGSCDNEAWYQKGFCSDMAKECGIEVPEIKTILIGIAQKAKLLADNVGLDMDNEDDAEALKAINDIISEKWIVGGLASQGRDLELAIDYIIEKYESGNDTDENNEDEEDFIDSWEYTE